MYLYKVDIADRCGFILSTTRTNAGISRRVMSTYINVSETTIKAWENGQGSPTLSSLLDWFHIVGVHPFGYMLEFFWPNPFKSLSQKSTDAELRNALSVYLKEVAGPREIRKLHYLIMGEYEGHWSGVLDMFCAHAHTSLHNRYKIAEIIQTSFDLSISDPDYLQNDLSDHALLHDAIQAARNAALEHKEGYSLLKTSKEYSQVSPIIMKEARLNAGKSQSFLAKALSKTERTIRNWEQNSEATFLDMCMWFHVLDEPMWSYMRSKMIIGESLEFSNTDLQFQNELLQYCSQLGHSELRKLCFLIFWKHGSNWHSLLELMIEHVNSPLSQRVISARSVLIGYEMDSNDARLFEPIGILPDLDNLKKCIEIETQVAKSSVLVSK